MSIAGHTFNAMRARDLQFVNKILFFEAYWSEKRKQKKCFFQNNTGHLKIVILGNSWAAQEAHVSRSCKIDSISIFLKFPCFLKHFQLVREYFPKEKVSEMHLFSQSSFTFGMHGDKKVIKSRKISILRLLQH